MYDLKIINKIKEYMLLNKQTVAVAESVTSGNLQAALSLAADASKFFQGGITTYNIGQKCRHLHIEPTHALSCNCVSQKIADDMAINACKLFLSDWGIGITGYAAPVPECSIEKVFAYYSFAFRNENAGSKKIETDKTDGLEVQQYYTMQVLTDFSLLLK